MSLIIKIDKLRGRENYNGWSKKVRMYLITEGLWSSVTSVNSLNERIDNLKGRKNYNEWSRKLRSYLVAEGLWNIVRSERPSDIVKIKRVKYIIICSIDDDLLESIDIETTPYVIWTTVQKLCTSQRN